VKQIIKYCFCLIVYYCGLIFLFRRLFKTKSALILTYHRVIRDKDVAECISQPGMVVRKSLFERQMQYLRKAYDIVPLNQLIERTQSGRDFGRLCAVTYDDGWRDVYDNAYPILRNSAIPATIFLTTGYIDSARLFWPERITSALTYSAHLDDAVVEKLSRIDTECACYVRKIISYGDSESRRELTDRLITRMKTLSRDDCGAFVKNVVEQSEGSGESHDVRYMLDWDEVREMKANGISFGSHTVNHLLLTHVPIDEARGEIVDSKREVENKLGDPSAYFAYPNGNWNEDVKELVKDAGYSAAVVAANTTNNGNTDPFLYGRLNVHDGTCAAPWGSFSRAVFACEISGLLNLFRGKPAEY